MVCFDGISTITLSAAMLTVLASLSHPAAGFINTAGVSNVPRHTNLFQQPRTSTAVLRSACSRRRVSSASSRALLMATGDNDGGEGSSDVKLSRKAIKKAKARATKELSKGGGGRGGSAAASTAEAPATVSSAVVAEALRKQQQQPAGNTDADAARKAIVNMEQEEAKRLAERQARIDSVMQAKEATEDDPTAGVIPQVVADRMLKRMVPFFLLPAIGGVGVFVGVYVLAHTYDYTIPAYIVAYATQAPFFVALAGITYAILSSSWDEDREGSFLGNEEASKNLGIIMDGLRRSSDRMDVEDMIADQERAQRQSNRSERRRMKKMEDSNND